MPEHLLSRDGVPIKVGDFVYARPADHAPSEIVYLGRSLVVVRDEFGEPEATHARLCFYHAVSILKCERDMLAERLEDTRKLIPELESKIRLLDAKIANFG